MTGYCDDCGNTLCICDEGEVLDVNALISERDRLEAEVAALRAAQLDAIDCLERVMFEGQPFSLSQREEVRLAIESLKRALAGPGDRREDDR